MHILKILHTNYVTHDVKRFVLEKPKGFGYNTGQAAHLSINKPKWKNKKRPFTFTSLNEWENLEFIIKIYDDHDGVTHQLGKLTEGDEIILHDVFDTFKYRGKGLFIAGGTGITPFLAIFRALYASKNMQGHALIYSNKTQQDVILAEELHEMLGNAFFNVFTKQGVIGFKERRIDRDFLLENIGDFGIQFYVCGSKEFASTLSEALVSLGAKHESIQI